MGHLYAIQHNSIPPNPIQETPSRANTQRRPTHPDDTRRHDLFWAFRGVVGMATVANVMSTILMSRLMLNIREPRCRHDSVDTSIVWASDAETILLTSEGTVESYRLNVL
ncbi:hypothetical protein QCA50_013726 [Cerrena zonata]|uniref:Uncharacterized protein n=1 Tax=Cerrena zonata TaxID=2478898 RepID=A0AAW0FU10_9APHY